MRILITGSDTYLGSLLEQRLRPEHDLVLAPVSTDLRQPDVVAPLVQGVEAVAHLAVFERTPAATMKEAAEYLLRAGRGTYVLSQAALQAGVGRIVLASHLELLESYPKAYRVDETWQPRPLPTPDDLSWYVAELTLREFVRAEPIYGFCLRFGNVYAEGCPFTPPADATAALERALTTDLPPGHRWRLLHFDASGLFPADEAGKAPFFFNPAGA